MEHPVLPSPLAPYPGESLASLIVRTAGEFAFHDPRRLLTPIGLHRISLEAAVTRYQGEEAAVALRTLFSLDEDTFSRLCPWNSLPKRLTIFGHDVAAHHVSVAYRRFCPACLAEAPFHRSAWDLLLLAGCWRHRSVFRTTCAECGRQPKWNSRWPHLCSRFRCRADLSCQPPGEDLTPEGVEGCRATEALLERGVDGAAAPLGVGDTLRAASVLGAFALGGTVASWELTSLEPPSWRARAMRLGLEALADWPRGFASYLDDRRREHTSTTGRYGVVRDLGATAAWIVSTPGTETSRVLGAALDAYVAGRAEMTTRRAGVHALREAGQAARVLTLPQAARRFGMGVHSFRKIADRYGLFALAPSGSGAMSLISVDALEALMARREGCIGRAEACRLMSVERVLLRHIVRAGLLPEMAPDDRLGRDLMFERTEIAGLLTRLEAMAQRRTAAVGTWTARQVSFATTGGITGVLRAVLAGKVRPVGVDTDACGVDRLQFAPGRPERAPRLSPDRYVEPRELSRMLGIDRTSMTEMVGAGLFGQPDEQGVWTKHSRPVTHEAVQRFRQEYIMTPEIAELTGLPWQGLRGRLEALGVGPVSGPGVDGLRRLVFRRREVEAVVGRMW